MRHEYALSDAAYIEAYRTRFDITKRQRKIARQDAIPSLQAYRLEPNSMQVQFVENMRRLIDSGANKALLISATGDGGIIVTSQAKTA